MKSLISNEQTDIRIWSSVHGMILQIFILHFINMAFKVKRKSYKR